MLPRFYGAYWGQIQFSLNGLPHKVPTAHQEQFWGSVSCSRILPHSGVHRLFEGRKEKVTLPCSLAPKRAVYHVLTSQGGSSVCLACFFGSQGGTLAHIFQQLGHGGATVHITASTCTSVPPQGSQDSNQQPSNHWSTSSTQ